MTDVAHAGGVINSFPEAGVAFSALEEGLYRASCFSSIFSQVSQSGLKLRLDQNKHRFSHVDDPYARGKGVNT